ncbi:RdgB/HAM1 family non-canonical purine NTP pyrophosphatase [Nitratifractor salsuginis]|uniref:dITP/XTP pyrophosphatase n=1 Tax=Nitratifractor salsuginis (strain DSM 16511 / JCM 12458 / E9I37-1) TaxID=749222 RepID=E6X2I8_NITSE|nr:RdgB/HAM1 family non-canonical purine NTP pyrophosphatase [Nitratifractor salsuginis]ADV47193.1 dITPase [Nitratifractor salsuginis DSM 16511]
MQWVLATGNRGKLREFREAFGKEILGMDEVLDSVPEIVEDADTFAGNALIKAKAIYDLLGPDYLVISDDSGISVPVLGGAPGIYSARYAGEGATDRENLQKLIEVLKERGIQQTPAYYTAALAIVGALGEYVVHGWMHGKVIDEARGDKGFGYDPIFIPEGYDRTLGELDESVKAGISHRAKAITLARPVLELLQRRGGE